MTRKVKVLIVDDEKSFTEMLKLNLEDYNEYSVRTESEGAKAAHAARVFKPDIIFLDVIMPDMDGGAVLARLKDEPETRDIPVVFLTAIVADDESRAMGSVISGYPVISKPVSTSKLVQCIKKNVGF